MYISLILAHPDKNSFNHAIAESVYKTLRGKHEVFFHDLYEENFDPVLPSAEFSRNATLSDVISDYCDEMMIAEGIIIVHPNWWGQPPAILKGWTDRIIRPGVAYEFLEGDKGEGIPRGLLKAKAALVLNTSNTETEREKNTFGDPLETLWKNCIFGLCGVNNFYRKVFNVIAISSEEQRKKWLQEAGQLADNIFN